MATSTNTLLNFVGTKAAVTGNNAVNASSYIQWTKSATALQAIAPKNTWVSLTFTLKCDNGTIPSGANCAIRYHNSVSDYAYNGTDLGLSVTSIGQTATKTYTPTSNPTIQSIADVLNGKYLYARVSNSNGRIDKWTLTAVLTYNTDSGGGTATKVVVKSVTTSGNVYCG